MSVPAGNRRLCVAYDIESYSRRDQFSQFDAQSRLTELLDSACAAAGLAVGDCRFQQQGDGGLALLPTGGSVDDPRLIDAFVRSLITGLATVNRLRSAEARIRLRVAVHEGVVFTAAHGYVGGAVVDVFRMCDAAPTRSALIDNPRADLVLVAADGVYRDVLMHGHHTLPGDAFERHELRVKDYAGVGWIHVPGRVVPPAASGATASAGAPSSPEPEASRAVPPAPTSTPAGSPGVPAPSASGPQPEPEGGPQSGPQPGSVLEELFGAGGYEL
ncbi:hypothetical protein [Streptacidiphilus sp. EB129]|uniref:hypothetical protein n=1 Tax=Streptacidiphilus sp. EB129 TaxID=3156262 RepID=UPI003515476C